MKPRTVNIIIAIIQSGLIVAIISMVYYVGAKATELENNSKAIAEIKNEQKSVAEELKVTRETMIKDIGEIKGDVKVLMQRIH